MGKRGTSLLCLLLMQGAAFGQAPIDGNSPARLGAPTILAASELEPQAMSVAMGRQVVPPETPRPNPNRPVAPLLSADQFGPQRADNSAAFWCCAEYVSWWVQGSKLPPLVTTSPAGTPLANAGVLGTPGAAILLGDDEVNRAMRPGGRFGFGVWFNDSHTCGLEAGLMFIGGHTSSFNASSDGSQIITRPFVDATTSAEIAEVVSFPGVVAGSVAVRSSSDPLIIADVVLRSALCDDCARHVDFLIGYRYLHFAETLQIQENLTSLDPLTLGANFQIGDRFATRNDFNGVLVGLETEWTIGPWSLQIFGKLAAGNLRREVNINGSTVITSPGTPPFVYPGGLLALPSNSGTFVSDHFVCLPELGLTAGWQITPCLRATLGYSLLWLTDFVRPGDQIDRTVNPNLLPPALPSTPIRPIFTLRDSDFWVQGIRVGLEFRF